MICYIFNTLHRDFLVFSDYPLAQKTLPQDEFGFMLSSTLSGAKVMSLNNNFVKQEVVSLSHINRHDLGIDYEYA